MTKWNQSNRYKWSTGSKKVYKSIHVWLRLDTCDKTFVYLFVLQSKHNMFGRSVLIADGVDRVIGEICSCLKNVLAPQETSSTCFFLFFLCVCFVWVHGARGLRADSSACMWVIDGWWLASPNRALLMLVSALAALISNVVLVATVEMRMFGRIKIANWNWWFLSPITLLNVVLSFKRTL